MSSERGSALLNEWCEAGDKAWADVEAGCRVPGLPGRWLTGLSGLLCAEIGEEDYMPIWTLLAEDSRISGLRKMVWKLLSLQV